MTVETFEFDVPVAISRPPKTKYLSTPGSLEIAVSILRTARSVRSVEAPSGSRTELKKAPWSSLGRKPTGSFLNRLPANRTTATRPSTARALRRIRNVTPVRYRLVVQSNVLLNQSNGRESQ